MRLLLGQLGSFPRRETVTDLASPASCSRVASACSESRPSRNWSREREMWPSCCEPLPSAASSSRCRLLALCLSRSESLMWSARRKSWFVDDMVAESEAAVRRKSPRSIG